MAHELRTPLSAIAAAAEIMKDQRFGTIGERTLSRLTLPTSMTTHGTHWRMINRLLGGDAVGDAGDGLQKPRSSTSTQLAESSVSAIRPLAEEAGLKLAHEFHGHLPRVTADGTTVKQILFNLLTNAIKFTPPPRDVRVVTGLGYDRSVFVAVQDTGVGHDRRGDLDGAQHRRCRPTRSARKAGGHGIGLPLAQILAKANGARIEIDSTPERRHRRGADFPQAIALWHAWSSIGRRTLSN